MINVSEIASMTKGTDINPISFSRCLGHTQVAHGSSVLCGKHTILKNEMNIYKSEVILQFFT